MDRKRLASLLVLFLAVFAAPFVGEAADTDLESTLQKDLEESTGLLKIVREKLTTGGAVSADLSKLKAVAEEIRVSNLLLQERFALREEKIQNLGNKIEARHRAMVEGYRKTLQDYLNLMETLPSGNAISPTLLNKLETLLNQIFPKKKLPILGIVPYRNRNLRYALEDPTPDPPINPAYLGGNKSVAPDDLKGASSAAIAALAQSLNWNPVSIYEWVKNNVATEWYFGCMKGAEETLRQKSGNDCDQAALLVALLRAAGYPTRYVRGVIEFFPDLTQAKNLTGIDDERQLASFFQKAGIPFRPVIAGGKIANLQIEHIWVESQIPYSNYRGAIIDAQGKTWLALDTSIKAAGYRSTSPPALPAEPFLSQIRNQYLGALQTQTPLEFIQTALEGFLSQSQPDKHYPDLLRRRTLLPEVLNILPASLQFKQIKVTQEYAEIPSELSHRVRFIASDQNRHELFNVILNAAQLSNRKVLLTYEPESVEDQQTIDLYGGLDNTPAYLVRLRPVLKVDDERIIVAQDGLPMGDNFTLTIEMISPNGVETFSTEPIVGNLSALGIVSEKAVLPDAIPDTEKSAERLLYEEALRYIDRWGQAEEELASLMRLSLSRPIPTLVVVGGVIDVTYLLNAPHGFTWKGVYVDAALRTIEVERSANVGDDLRKVFMQLSALQGSVLEERIFKEDFQVESISTAKLLTLATAGAVPIVTLDRTNIDTILPTLSFADEIQEDLRNAVNQGLTVTIPSRQVSYLDWSGIGYLKEDLEIGESGWMLSGQIAGGESAQSPERWVNQLFRSTLGEAYAGESNQDALSAASIIKIPPTDRQEGTVGTFLDQPLSVLVRDKDGLPVKGASVTFRVIAGGGGMGPVPGASTVTVVTAQNGIAKAPFLLGKKTSDNPFYQKPNPADLYYTQTGLNLVTATVKSTGLELSLLQPFEEYGLPDLPHHLVKILGEGNASLVNNPGGSIKVLLADQYENPISNQVITFAATNATSDITLPEGYRSITFYRKEDCPNPYPIFGDCPTQASLAVTSQYFGALAETLLGNTVNTTYTVQVSTPGALSVAPTTFTLYSLGFRGQSGSYIPPALLLGALGVVNDNGQPVNAVQVGKELKAPLISELFSLSDDYTMAPDTCVRNGQPVGCFQIKASDTVDVKRIVDGTVTYNITQGGGSVAPTPAENLNNGKYQARYTAGLEPLVNQIQAAGQATITVPEVLYDPVTLLANPTGYNTSTLPTRSVSLNAGQSVRFDRDTRQPILRTLNTGPVSTVYAVEVRLDVTPSLVLLNEEGYTADDTTFSYTILPPEYNAGSVRVDLFKTDSSNNPTWQTFIQGDRTQTPFEAGQFVKGTVVVVKGTQFDIKNRYQAEAVVNPGSDMEVRGRAIINQETGTPTGLITTLIGQVTFFDPRPDPITGDIKPVEGAVTDNTTELLLRLSVNPNQNQSRLPSLDWGIFDPEIEGSVEGIGTLLKDGQPATTVPVVFNDQGVAEVRYRAPETFIRFGTGMVEETKDRNRAERSVQVKINNITGGIPAVRLRRPPLILVHGTGGSPKSTWEYFEPFNSGDGDKYFVTFADYSEPPFSNIGSLEQNFGPFEPNYKVIRLAIFDAIEGARAKKIAATKVDIISHSLGGLVAREYCRKEGLDFPVRDCSEKIRKLITLGTPHLGTKLANELQKRKTLDTFLKFIDSVGKLLGYPAFLGPAHDEQAVESKALLDLAHFPMPPALMHFVIGKTPDNNFGYSGLAVMWKLLLRPLFKLVPDESFDLTRTVTLPKGQTGVIIYKPVFPKAEDIVDEGRNDRLVPMKSARNNTPGFTSVIQSVDHVTMHGDERHPMSQTEISCISQLLNVKETDSIWTGGCTP